jgi:archaeal chaperonin
MLAGTPVILLREGTGEAKGVEAQKEIVRAARAVAEAVRSTLGPRGMDKMMVDSIGDVVITNDGATILKQMEIQHPAGKMLAEIAKAQDQECGDGTKTCVILTGELLHKAEELLAEKVHPTQITLGYQIAAERALERLSALGRPVKASDTELLRKIAMTSMISKGVASYREELATLAVQAVTEVVDLRDGGVRFDRKNIQLLKKQGDDIHRSELIEGHIVEQGTVHPDMPKVVSGARIALFEAALEMKKTEFSAEIRITSAAQMQSFLDEEARLIQAMVDAVVRSGANVVFTEKGIDDVAAEHLSKAGVYAVRRVKRSDLELLARATGARLVARAADVGPGDLGSAGRVEERKIGDDPLTVVTDCPKARAVTILIRGGSQHVVDEVERSLIDAVMTVGISLEDGLVVTGAGATMIELGQHLREFASTVGGREQIAVEAYAAALDVIPVTLAENAGMDTVDTLIELRRRHKAGDRDAGVDVLQSRVADMDGVAVEPIRVPRQALLGATEASTMLLRIDDVIAARRTAPTSPPKGGGPSPAGAFA